MNTEELTCGLCGHRFLASESAGACASCGMAGGCHKVRCPRCGYEMAPPARLPRVLKTLLARLKGTHKG